jgi:hypothetical protein
MDFGSILIGLALLAAVAFIVARPLLEQRGLPREKTLTPADQLVDQREHILSALRDLDFDHATGKIADEDYTPQRAQLVAEGVAVLKQLDALGFSENHMDDEIERAVAALRARKPRDAQNVEDFLEAEIASRRQRNKRAQYCPACGQPAQPEDKFCANCGARLSPVDDMREARTKR